MRYFLKDSLESQPGASDFDQAFANAAYGEQPKVDEDRKLIRKWLNTGCYAFMGYQEFLDVTYDVIEEIELYIKEKYESKEPISWREVETFRAINRAFGAYS